MKKIMKKLTDGATRLLVLALGLGLTATGWADFAKTNPVTGETENYTWKFTGTDTWNNTGYWQNSDGTPPVGVPAKSGDSSWGGSDDQWLPILFDGSTIQINAGMLVEGWNLRMGLYNGANITLNHLVKLRSGMSTWFTVDENSTLTIAGMDNNKLEGSNPLCLYSARANGIAWTPELSNSAIGTGVQMPLHYYLAGDGTVAFNGGITLTSAQVIKRADVTLSEATSSKTVRSKTLVSFASTSTSTFSADAETTIKVKNSDGTALKDVNLTSVTATDTTLTTAGNVGDCELVQTSTGVVLYYVDYANTYKPSININFTNGAGNGLTTSADVGLDGYAVPGTSWNNFVVANNTTFNTVNAIDSTGAASVASGVSVSISGTRGHWNCSNLTPASNPLHGYIDESADGPTPTVTITGIPYEHYRVIVYHSTDQNGAKFGYDTINGFNFTYVDGVQTEGTTSWGSAGAANSAEPIGEGTNTLVSAVLSGDTVTMVAHRVGGGSPSARGCFAAIQVVEYVPEVGENDLEIAVDGAKEYEVAEAKELSGTVYLTGSGTLTLTGSEKITAATIDVAKDVVLNINADRLDATTFTGAGTVVYDTTAPVEGKGWANIGWSGTVWIKNQSVSSFEGTKFGNAASTVRFTGVTGFLQTSSWSGSTYVHTVPLELVDEGNTVAFTYNNGWGGNLVKINTLKGTGTLYTEDKGSGEHIYIVDASGFTGVFNLTCKYVYVGGSQPADYSASTNPNGKLEIRSGVTMTVPSGKTWTANGGFVVNGTLNVNGTLASSHTTKAVSGAGTVVFTGRAPTVSGDAWWKNADWTGTVTVKSVTNLIGQSGSGTYIDFNEYGNTGSVIELDGVTGWVNPAYTCNVPLKITNTLYLNNGHSNKANAFKVGTLLGAGTISGDSSAGQVVFNVTTDWSGFTGTIGLNNKCVVFGKTIPDTITAGQIYISEGAVVTPQQSSGTWWAVSGIKVDGELRAPNLGKFGGGTTITTSDTGVFTLTDSNNTQDQAVDYARITGTGTLRYADVSGKWRTLSRVNFPTNMVCENNLSEGLILQASGAEHVIGSLAGSGVMRSDWGGSQNVGDRSLKILQAKDTVYSGLFHSDDRITTVTVAPGVSSAGTLTLSNTQTVSNDLAIESGAAVNLTGTWKGPTTVAGTFGGTGTLTGNLTFSDGATFKANASTLTVSGTVSLPAEEGETLTIDATGLSAAEVTVLSSSSITAETDVSKVTVNGPYIVTPVAGAIKLVHAVAQISGFSTVYISLQAAVDALAENNKDIVLLANAGGATVSREVTFNVVPGEYTYGDVVASGNYIRTVTALEGKTKYSFAPAVIAVTINEVRTLYPMMTANNGIEAANAGPIGTTIEILSGDPASYAAYLPMFDLENGVFTKVTDPVAAVYSGVVQVNVHRTLADAVDAAEAGLTVKLLANVSLDATVAISKTLTLDLNGYAITASGIDAITSSGALTIQGSSDSISVTSGDSVVLTSAAATLTVSGVTLSPTPTTTVENSYVKLDGSTYSVDAYNAVTITAPNATATRTDALGNAIKDGDTITFTVTPSEGYHVVSVSASVGEVSGSGPYSYTVSGNATITVTTALDSSVTIGAATFSYEADFTNATVSVAVTEVDAQDVHYTLTVNNKNYTGTASNGTVVFDGVEIPRGSAYDSVSYTITSDATTTTGEMSGASVVADVYDWITEDIGHPEATGNWETDIAYDGTTAAATIVDNKYTPTSPSSNDVVTITVNDVVYPELSDETEILTDAQAAICLGTNGTSEVVFKVLVTNGTDAAHWEIASGVTAAKDVPYDIALTFDYTKGTYSATVNGSALTVAGATSWGLCSSATSVSNIEFMGSGSIKGIQGTGLEGNMIVDLTGKKYATIQAAIDALTADATLAPLTKLHAGTPPEGWRFDGNTLIKIAKGMFFFAF